MTTAVTAPDVLELRPPRAVMTLYGLSVVIVVLVVANALTTGPSVQFRMLFLVFVLGIAVYNTATVLSRVRAHGDGALEVRNRFSTRRLQRSDVDRVMVGRQGGLGTPRRLELLLTDGETLQLVATEVPPLPGLRRRLDDQAEDLRAWLAESSRPYR
jgi:hypothetical protein